MGSASGGAGAANKESVAPRPHLLRFRLGPSAFFFFHYLFTSLLPSLLSFFHAAVAGRSLSRQHSSSPHQIARSHLRPRSRHRSFWQSRSRSRLGSVHRRRQMG